MRRRVGFFDAAKAAEVLHRGQLYNVSYGGGRQCFIEEEVEGWCNPRVAWNPAAHVALAESSREVAEVVCRTSQGDPESAVGYRRTKESRADAVRYLRAEHLALPAVGSAPVDFLPLLDPEVRSLLEPVQDLFEWDPGERGGRRRRPCFRVKPEEYGPLLLRLKEVSMVDFLEVPALRENGVFGVPESSVEDPLTRMITDGESTNWFTKRLPKVRLPNPESLSRLPRWCRKAAALDIHSFYNCLKLPAGWRKYFGLPKIRASEVGGPENVWWYPVNSTLPMGWTGSVWLGQLVHEALFKQATMSLGEECTDLHFVSLCDAEAVRAAEFLPQDQVVFYSIYIDDLNLFGIH